MFRSSFPPYHPPGRGVLASADSAFPANGPEISRRTGRRRQGVRPLVPLGPPPPVLPALGDVFCSAFDDRIVDPLLEPQLFVPAEGARWHFERRIGSIAELSEQCRPPRCLLSPTFIIHDGAASQLRFCASFSPEVEQDPCARKRVRLHFTVDSSCTVDFSFALPTSRSPRQRHSFRGEPWAGGEVLANLLDNSVEVLQPATPLLSQGVSSLCFPLVAIPEEEGTAPPPYLVPVNAPGQKSTVLVPSNSLLLAEAPTGEKDPPAADPSSLPEGESRLPLLVCALDIYSIVAAPPPEGLEGAVVPVNHPLTGGVSPTGVVRWCSSSETDGSAEDGSSSLSDYPLPEEEALQRAKWFLRSQRRLRRWGVREGRDPEEYDAYLGPWTDQYSAASSIPVRVRRRFLSDTFSFQEDERFTASDVD